MTNATNAETIYLVEIMPDHLRGSHRAAGNWGAYPHNGAERMLTTRPEDAIDQDGEYDRVIRRATPADLARYASLYDYDTGDAIDADDLGISDEEYAAAVAASLTSDDPTGAVSVGGRTVYAD